MFSFFLKTTKVVARNTTEVAAVKKTKVILSKNAIREKYMDYARYLNSDVPVDLPSTRVSNAGKVAFGRALVTNKGFCNAGPMLGPGVIISSTI